MDLEKIGLFIKVCRKNVGLTQEGLAEKLNISFKTVSRWECGLGLPDVSTMIPLCEILNISLNELLNGCHIEDDNYMDKADEMLLEMTKMHEETTKRLLFAEYLITITMILLTVGTVLVACFVDMSKSLRLGLIMGTILIDLILISFCIKIEQKAGYYKCPECGESYVPTFKQVFFSLHFGRTRYMKCPKCHHYHYQHKVTKK